MFIICPPCCVSELPGTALLCSGPRLEFIQLAVFIGVCLHHCGGNEMFMLQHCLDSPCLKYKRWLCSGKTLFFPLFSPLISGCSSPCPVKYIYRVTVLWYGVITCTCTISKFNEDPFRHEVDSNVFF